MAGPVPSTGPHHGRVTSFDPTRGLGVVAEVAGDVLDFHATAIADGSRNIEVGTEVSFTVAPGHRGRYEARSLVPLATPAAAPASAASAPSSAPGPASA